MSLCLSHYLEKFPVSGGQREDAGGGGAIREESQRQKQKWTVCLKFLYPSDFSSHISVYSHRDCRHKGLRRVSTS